MALNLNVKTRFWPKASSSSSSSSKKKKAKKNRKQFSHCEDKYLSRLSVPRSVLKRQKESEPSCFWDSPQTWRGTICREKRRKRNQTFRSDCFPAFAATNFHVNVERALSLVVGHGPAGQHHQGEGGERQAVNGVAGQSEACPLGYLSQEVGPGHELKHSACGREEDWGITTSTLANKQTQVK